MLLINDVTHTSHSDNSPVNLFLEFTIKLIRNSLWKYLVEFNVTWASECKAKNAKRNKVADRKYKALPLKGGKFIEACGKCRETFWSYIWSSYCLRPDEGG